MTKLPSKNTHRSDDPEFARTGELSNIRFVRTGKGLTPTEAICAELQGAYSYLNKALFGGELPECVLSLERNNRATLGFFAPNSFVSLAGNTVHQISINPHHILAQPDVEVLSTLLHEMCQLAIWELTKPKKITAYHCKKWAALMLAVGLQPTNDGTPEGKPTGHNMTHLIIPDGLFDRASRFLLDRGFALSWGLAKQQFEDDIASPNSGGGGGSSDGKKKARKKGKVKFSCPTCGALAWAAPSRRLICGEDFTAMVAES